MLRDRVAHYSPWAGLVVGATLWALYQQTVADALHFSCRGIGFTGAIVAGVITSGIIAVAGIISFKSANDAHTRGFVGAMNAVAAMIFALAVVLQTIAAWLVPPCFP